MAVVVDVLQSLTVVSIHFFNACFEVFYVYENDSVHYVFLQCSFEMPRTVLILDSSLVSQKRDTMDIANNNNNNNNNNHGDDDDDDDNELDDVRRSRSSSNASSMARYFKILACSIEFY